MTTQIRDAQFGRLVRLLSRRKAFQYPDEIDPSIRKSAARRGDVVSRSEEKDAEPNSDGTASGERLDQGEDIHLVGWYGENDPEVSRGGRT